jgi:hypothetical protein
MFYDKEHLKSTLNIKSVSKFTYNNQKYSAYIAKDERTLLIKCFDTDIAIPYPAWLNNIYHGYYKDDEANTSTTAKTTDIIEPPKPLEYLAYIKPSLIDDEFMKSMEIEAFRKEYAKHPNIKRFDYATWSKEQKAYSALKEHDILFATYGDDVNIRHQASKQNIKGGKNTGVFIQGAKKNVTLLLCEGLKDGINASIGFGNVDILITDGKSQAYDFAKYGIDLSLYKNIIFLNDIDVTDAQIIKLFSKMDSKEHAKVKMIDKKTYGANETDITDILKKFYANEAKSTMKRKALSLLKKYLLKTSFSEIHKEAKAKELNAKALHAIENNKPLNYIIKEKAYYGFNMENEARHIISKPLHSAQEHSIGLKKYLSDFAPHIIKIIQENHITLLNSPTNTGKSTLVKNEIKRAFKNIIYIAPLRTVVDEFSLDNSFTNVSQKGQSIEATLADLNAPFVAMTTDVFFNLLSKFPNEMKQRLSDVALIVFDEQHLISESENFREKVTEVNKYLLNSHSGKVLFMSGTPHIESDKITVIKATVAKEHKDDIYYYNNAFEDEEGFIASVSKEVKKHSIMVYCSSTQKVDEVTNVLRAKDTPCFSITSKAILWNKQKPKEDSLDPKKQKFEDYTWSETCVYVCTTRATTGLNLPNLKGIYQYGTAYNSNTFIQLMARLRSGGFYHYITPFRERNALDSIEERVIGICSKFQGLGIDKLSLSFGSDAMEHYLVENLSMEKDKRNLKGFLGVYGVELSIIEAFGLGKFSIEKDDYIFNLQDKNIAHILKGLDEVVERKYIDRVLIDYLNKNNISLLNEIYNLSFVIHYSTISKNDSELRLITEEDKEKKKAKNADNRLKTKAQKEKILAKIGQHFSYATLNNAFNAGQIDCLIESKNIDEERIAKAMKPSDKLVILKEALIPIKAIVALCVNALIASEDIFTIKDLDILLQRKYTTQKRHKHPYSTFLKALFANVYQGEELRHDNRLMVKNEVKQNKKHYYDVIRFKEAFDPTQTKEFIDKEAKRIEVEYLQRLSDEATAKHGFEVVFE